MGFLDKILKGAVNAIDDAVQQNTGSKSGLGDLLNQAMNLKDQALGTSSSAPSAGAENNLPSPKPNRSVNGSLYTEGGNVPYTFLLSEDFAEFNSGAGEIDFSAAYAPDFDAEKDGDPYTPDASCIVLVNDAETEVRDVFEQYKKGANPQNTMMLAPVSGLGEKIFCKLKMKMRGQILYCYGMDRGNGTYKNCYLGALYPPKVMGTALESRLIAEVDQVIKTYREG